MVRTTTAAARKGAITQWLLFAMPVLLAMLALALNAAWLTLAQCELRNGADAAALAAARVLASDDLLRGDADAIRVLLGRAQAEAVRYAAANQVVGLTLTLEPGDATGGVRDMARGSPFLAVDEKDDAQVARLNSVRVRAEFSRARGNPIPLLLRPVVLPRTDAITVATAALDRDVIGFRAPPQQPLPLMPIGLRSDPSGTDPQSWEYQVARQHGQDQYAFDAARQRFIAADTGDQLHELEVELPLGSEGNAEKGNATVLTIGTEKFADVAAQVCRGVLREELADRRGELVLGPDNRIQLPGSPVGPEESSKDFSRLLACLHEVQQEAQLRVWPLVSDFDDQTDTAVVSGFVAARIVRVQHDDGGPLKLILQPGLIVVPTAITDASRQAAGGIDIHNPYVCKVRLVE